MVDPSYHDASQVNVKQKGYLPHLLGIEWSECGPDRVEGTMTIAQHHLASNGYLHAASVVALADSAAGYGCYASLPDGSSGFTTAELKANYIGTARSGIVACVARPLHQGRTTQVWDVEVSEAEQGRTIAMFRCTQIILYPRSPVPDQQAENPSSSS